MDNPDSRLFFGKGNSKLGPTTFTFSLPAGHACPGAHKCKAWADINTGKVHDGAHAEFRCFAASDESRLPTVRRSRWHNFTLLQLATREEMAALIDSSLPGVTGKVRVHVSGDFFSQDYFDAWMDVAGWNPRLQFYAYTKSLPFWVNRINRIPSNFRLVASMGGTHDKLIREHQLPCAEVIFHPDEANGRPVDHRDDCASNPDIDRFTLLIHGTQPAGSAASAARSRLRAENVEHGYSRGKNARSYQQDSPATEPEEEFAKEI